MYTGLGADYNRAEAKGDGALNSPPTTINSTGGTPCGGAGTSITVRPEANINATGNVNPFLFRAFAGFRINLPYTRIFAQADKAFGNDLFSATAGVRFVY